LNLRRLLSRNKRSLFDGIWLKENWIQFKLYDDPAISRDWKSNLGWYHSTLRAIRSTIETHDVVMVLFTTYGPQAYEGFEREIAERSLPNIPDSDVSFVKLRLFPLAGSRRSVAEACSRRFDTMEGLWDYETLREYDALGDLGNRYGRDRNGVISQETTLRFIRYWDSGCRYILSIMSESGSWEEDVDVWGIPHLINNALGASLRIDVRCACGGRLCIATFPAQISPTQMTNTPLFLSCCLNCGRQSLLSTNI
jgi:hypothetical protein